LEACLSTQLEDQREGGDVLNFQVTEKKGKEEVE